MISKLFSKLPGFRTRKMWKIIIAIPAYLVLVLLFIGILSDGNKFTDSSLDSALKTFHNLIVVLIILIPLMLITNAVNLRTKLHVFKGKSVWKQCMSWFGVVLSIVIILIVVDTVIGNSYTSEYVLAESKYREEQAVIKAQQDAVAAKEKEEKSKADEQEKKLLAEAKEEKRAEEERLKKEQMALAEKQKEEARIKEEQRKLDEEAAKEAEKKKQEELQEKVAQTSDDDVDTIVPKPMEAEPMEVMDGFNLFQTDGFAIQVPYTWHSVSSRFTRSLESKFSTELDVDDTPIRETYDINFKTDMQFTSIIEIRRYDGSEDYEKYAKMYVTSSIPITMLTILRVVGRIFTESRLKSSGLIWIRYMSRLRSLTTK